MLDRFGQERIRWITPNERYYGYQVRLPKQFGSATAYFGRAQYGSMRAAHAAAVQFLRLYCPDPAVSAYRGARIPQGARVRGQRYMLTGVTLKMSAAGEPYQVRALIVRDGAFEYEAFGVNGSIARAVELASRARLAYERARFGECSAISARDWGRIAAWHVDWFGRIAEHGMPPLPAGLVIRQLSTGVRASYCGEVRTFPFAHTSGGPRDAALQAVLWAAGRGASLRRPGTRRRSDESAI